MSNRGKIVGDMPTLVVRNGITQLDEVDYEWAKPQTWHMGDTGYVKTHNPSGNHSPLKMHRLIFERMIGRPLRPGEFVDHKNRIKTDNRRSNLRLATKSQNGMNLQTGKGKTSRYIGVHCDRSRRYKRWMAYVAVDQKRWQIGRFYSEEEAAWMRDQWAVQLHGEFASLNFEYLPV
jgi:HNH endonuclease